MIGARHGQGRRKGRRRPDAWIEHGAAAEQAGRPFAAKQQPATVGQQRRSLPGKPTLRELRGRRLHALGIRDGEKEGPAGERSGKH